MTTPCDIAVATSFTELAKVKALHKKYDNRRFPESLGRTGAAIDTLNAQRNFSIKIPPFCVNIWWSNQKQIDE